MQKMLIALVVVLLMSGIAQGEGNTLVTRVDCVRGENAGGSSSGLIATNEEVKIL